MQKRPNNRRARLLRNKPLRGIALMTLGVALLAMGIPENWIDLAALALAAVTAGMVDTTPPRQATRKRRNKRRGNRGK
ncbi:hypothetical protein [Streptomyces sp. NPDC005953]|uniref:hypothetical protein n=1 Tax=Streptomyces sp. NPDC005953 TaxID=3156719 RepID=UPI0033E6B247